MKLFLPFLLACLTLGCTKAEMRRAVSNFDSGVKNAADTVREDGKKVIKKADRVRE